MAAAPDFSPCSTPSRETIYKDYEDFNGPSAQSYLLAENYAPKVEQIQLCDLIQEWLDDTSDHDLKYWPSFEKQMNENRLKFRNES